MPIPDELKRYPQWVVWRLVPTDDGKQTKHPFNPHTGQLASVIDPRTWSTFDHACQVASDAGACYSGIGFVLTENDPYTIIDLDDPAGDWGISVVQQRIASTFQSYSEVSQSGKGLHIITYGSLPGDGRKRNKVEMYSSRRYFAMTGNTYHSLPIADRQSLITQLYRELAPKNTELPKIVEQQERYPDDDIYNTAANAENGQKFLALWRGEWRNYYQSQSEADYSLINMIGFYSRNAQQIRRMFLNSALGQRDKAQRTKYLMDMIQRSFDNMPPEVDISAIIGHGRSQIDKAIKQTPLIPESPQQYDWTVPPGLLGEIAQFIYSAAPRPVKEIALSAAIGLMAGIVGRSYNISNTGLNHYVLTLATTGVGKDAMGSGISRLMEAVKVFVPAALEFLGPAEIASGPALIKALNKQPCFVSIVGEYGLEMQQMCGQFASAPKATLRRIMLALYTMSGAGQVLRPSVYSDQAKNTEIVNSPAFTLLGESTPDTFYQSLDETMIKQGLFPRLTIIEYSGKRPDRNEGHETAQPSQQLVQKICEMATNCLMMQQHGRVLIVQFEDGAKQLSDAFDKRCDNHINGTNLEIALQLWTRAHVKAMKLAALIAVGFDFYTPTITTPVMQWAIDVVTRDINNIMTRFEHGSVGLETSEVAQIEKLRAIIEQYLVIPYTPSMTRSYGVVEQMKIDGVVAHQFLQKRLLSNPAFQKDPRGATAALDRAIRSFVTDGALYILNENKMMEKYKRTAKAYIIVDQSRFIHR